MPMSSSSRHHVNSHVLLILLILLLPHVCSAAGQFSTLAISHVPNATLVCALVLPQAYEAAAAADADDATSSRTGGGYKLDCTSLPDGERVSYPSADVPYSAIAAGHDFLCGLMAPAGGHAAMRWWSFSEEAAANRSRPVGRRLYWGPSLRALSAGGPHVCGLSDAHDPTCWEWPQLSLPPGTNFSRIALGDDFLCGILAADSKLLCLGVKGSVTADAPKGVIKSVAAGRRHACAVDEDGGFMCWGDDSPVVSGGELPESMWAMALGDKTTCILAGNATVRCWGVTVPVQYADSQFVAIEAAGDTVCGVMVATYALVCWGNSRFKGGRKVYNDTMPGACAPKLSCPCDVFPGSGQLCGNGGGEGANDYAVCHPCTVSLNASRISIAGGNGRNPVDAVGGDDGDGRKKAVVVALGVAGAGLGVIAAVGLAFYLVVFKKWDKKAHVIVRLGESPSSLRICRDVEAVVMPTPHPSPATARGLGCEEFVLKELVRVTSGFSEEKKVGSGSFGSVYRARLADGREVAIKRAERASSGGRRRRRYDSERAFRAELKLLSRVNHRNLVQLVGFCEERGERILVFEFMPHGALHDHLHGRRDDGGLSPLFASWEARLRVALDAARGVEYLHCYAVPPVIHRDVKPSNILLDAEWTAKVSDFGLSLASGSASVACSTSATAGTVGYIDPEYYRLQELTERSDVYSFGVVLLELVTGRKAIHRTSQDGSGSPRNVIEYAVPAVDTGDIAKVLDSRVPAPRGHETEAVTRVARIAAECVRQRGRSRPVMSEVVAELEWAVALCEEAVAAQHSSRHGSELSRSESDDPSPFHTREFGFGSSRRGQSKSYSAT